MSARLLRVLALSALATPLLAQVESRSLKGEKIAIYNLAGRLKATAGTGDAVVVEVTRGGKDAAQLKIETGPIRDFQTLRIIYPSDRIVYPDMRGYRSRSSFNVRPDGTFGGGGWGSGDRDRVEIRTYGDGLEAYADLNVRIPKGQRIELVLGVGRVEVSNVEGQIAVDVASADVDVTGVKGNLTLDTGSGRVTVRDVTGDLNVDTGSGGLTVDNVKGNVLRIDSGSGGVQGSDIEVREINADVGSGGLRLSRVKSPNVVVETGSGGATIELLSDIEKLDVETGSGGVTIRAPATLSAEVDAESGSGGFSTDFEIVTRRVGRNHVSGRIGDGRGRIRLESGSGTLRLQKN
jgi:lia operon protein LiaG